MLGPFESCDDTSSPKSVRFCSCCGEVSDCCLFKDWMSYLSSSKSDSSDSMREKNLRRVGLRLSTEQFIFSLYVWRPGERFWVTVKLRPSYSPISCSRSYCFYLCSTISYLRSLMIVLM